jgi:hypothetical protein
MEWSEEVRARLEARSRGGVYTNNDGSVMAKDLRAALARIGAQDRELAEARTLASSLRIACDTSAADLIEAGRICGIAEDEYPLKAVQRVVRELAEARAEVERLMQGGLSDEIRQPVMERALRAEAEMERLTRDLSEAHAALSEAASRFVARDNEGLRLILCDLNARANVRSAIEEAEAALAAEREAHAGTKARYDKLWNSDACADVRAERERSERRLEAVRLLLAKVEELGDRHKDRSTDWDVCAAVRMGHAALRDTAPEPNGRGEDGPVLEFDCAHEPGECLGHCARCGLEMEEGVTHECPPGFSAAPEEKA